MKRTIALFALMLSLSAVSFVYAEPFAACAQPAAQADAASGVPVSLDSIFAAPDGQGSPGAVPATPYACAVQTQCPSGLYIGCQSYTDPNGCEVVPHKCLMCDGQIYRCNGVFCPY